MRDAVVRLLEVQKQDVEGVRLILFVARESKRDIRLQRCDELISRSSRSSSRLGARDEVVFFGVRRESAGNDSSVEFVKRWKQRDWSIVSHVFWVTGLEEADYFCSAPLVRWLCAAQQ